MTFGPLTALASGGVYVYGSANAFPSSTFQASNYWVDAVYSQSAGSTPPSVTTVTPSQGATGVAVSVAPTATFSQAVVPNTVSFTVKDSGGNTVAGAVSFNGANTVRRSRLRARWRRVPRTRPRFPGRRTRPATR